MPVGPVKPKEKEKPEIKKIETPPPKPEVKKPEPPKPEVKKTETPPKPEVKAPPKPEVTADQVLNQSLAKLQSKVKAKQEDEQLSKAMAALEAKSGTGGGTGAGEGDGKTALGVRGNGVGTELDSRMRDYYIVLYNIVSANWNMPPEKLMGGGKKLMAVYTFRIDKSGRISDGRFEQASGEDLFDQSAEKAVKRSQLPPLPDIFQQAYIEVGLRFTPSGVKKK
ncbi:MAG: TonB C-terminal domain-containing protein [Deltaproteobacteria bacterium]|nr:TonB C-terminal domain-containing protein [Deltaproteobacteria bacterium]